MNRTLSHDGSQLRAAGSGHLAYTHGKDECRPQRERFTETTTPPPPPTPQIETNKALRLVKQVLLLAAGLTLRVDMCVRTRVSSVCWTHFRTGRKVAGRKRSYFCLKYIYAAPQWRQSSGPPGPYVLGAKMIFPVCLPLLFFCVCACGRETEDVYEYILSDLWRRPRPGQEGQKRRETVEYNAPQRGFCYLLGLPR